VKRLEKDWSYHSLSGMQGKHQAKETNMIQSGTKTISGLIISQAASCRVGLSQRPRAQYRLTLCSWGVAGRIQKYAHRRGTE